MSSNPSPDKLRLPSPVVSSLLDHLHAALSAHKRLARLIEAHEKVGKPPDPELLEQARLARTEASHALRMLVARAVANADQACANADRAMRRAGAS